MAQTANSYQVLTFTVIKGDSKAFTLTYQTSAGVAINLTGATIWITVKENPKNPDSAALIQKTTTSHTNPSGGISVITLLPVETETLEFDKKYYMDIKTKLASGAIKTFRAMLNCAWRATEAS